MTPTEVPILKTAVAALRRPERDPEWLAKFLGVSTATARKIKKGHDLKLSQAMKLARHMGLKVEDLWSL